MQTFLPYSSFQQSAECLDWRRLGKQRVEALQICELLLHLSKSSGWVNHPIVKMWKGYEYALIEYGKAICKEWRRRGYVDNLLPHFEKLETFTLFIGSIRRESPPWLGNTELHKSHQSNLLRKNKEWYSQFGWNISPSLPYVWL